MTILGKKKRNQIRFQKRDEPKVGKKGEPLPRKVKKKKENRKQESAYTGGQAFKKRKKGSLKWP